MSNSLSREGGIEFNTVNIARPLGIIFSDTSLRQENIDKYVLSQGMAFLNTLHMESIEH